MNISMTFVFQKRRKIEDTFCETCSVISGIVLFFFNVVSCSFESSLSSLIVDRIIHEESHSFSDLSSISD